MKRRDRAFSTLEYMALILMVTIAFLVTGSYIHRAMQGQSRKAGETFADLRQHGAQISRDCHYDDQLGFWYSEKCYNHFTFWCKGGRTDNALEPYFCRDHIRQCVCEENEVDVNATCTEPAQGTTQVMDAHCPMLCCYQRYKKMCAGLCS